MSRSYRIFPRFPTLYLYIATSLHLLSCASLRTTMRSIQFLQSRQELRCALLASPRLAESEGQDEDSLAARARGLAHSKVKIRNFESEADLSPPPRPPARPVPFAPSSQPCRGGLKVCGCGWVPSYSHPRLIPTHPLHPVGPVQATPARSFFRRLPHCLI